MATSEVDRMRSHDATGDRRASEHSGARPTRVGVLLAHDPSARTCDALCAALRAIFPRVDIVDAPSAEYARTAGHASSVDVSMVCLDLPPAPLGGVRLAMEIAREKRPLVLVTRSLRWLPPSAASLRALPWVSPEATPAEVARAIAAACEGCAAVEHAADDAT
jgi:hypothetical protein